MKKEKLVHCYSKLYCVKHIYCDGQATRFPQEGRLAVRVKAAPAGVERICLEVCGKRCVARPLFQKGGGLRRQAGVGVVLASRGWAGQTPPPWHGGEPLPRPCHTRRLSLLSLHLHSPPLLFLIPYSSLPLSIVIILFSLT